MDYTISKQKAIDIVEFECGKWSGLARTIIKAFEQLPPAQSERCSDCIVHGGDWECDHIRCRKGRQPSSASETIIKCKDCKYRAYWNNCRLWEEKYHQTVLVDDDDFCSKAERKIDK